jgi:cardiolipin synthase
VWLETYIFADDEIGRRFADALAERARAGLDVRVYLDAAGSLFWLSPGLVRRMRRDGVRVRWFHRWSWRHPLRYNRRDHRKLLIVDSSIAFLGGFNIHRENSGKLYGPTRWRDTHVAVHGQLAQQAATIYAAFWRGRMPRQNYTGGPVSAVLLTNHTRRYRHRLRAFYVEIFQRARGSIFLTTPYFVPDSVLQTALLEAAERGVDVRLLLPARSDTRVARWAARALYARLLDGAVKIYEYQPRMLHAKTASVDGLWCTVGTANLDYRSFFTNYEINLFACDPALGARLHALFLDDLAESERILPGAWRRRFWLDRLPEFVGWLLRRWL